MTEINEEKIEEGKMVEEKSSVKDILHKNFPSTICQHCKKVTNIQFSNDFRKLISRNRTLGEMNKNLYSDWMRWMNIKNGQIEAMHKMIARLIELIPEEKKKNTNEITHEMRDEIRHAERKNMGLEDKEKVQKVYKPASFSNNNIYPGDPKGSPDESFSSDTLVFVDSAFLEKLSKHFGNGKYLKFDRSLLLVHLAEKQKLNCKSIFYYTAPPFQSSIISTEEEIKKKGYERFIKKLREKRVIVREGRCQRLKCEDFFVYKQKAVDILLAMDLMSVPLDYPEVRRIILISSDSDFVPIVENLQEKGVKIILYTYYEKIRDTPFSVSNHLIKSVYKYVLLTKEDFINSPLKKEVKNEK